MRGRVKWPYFERNIASSLVIFGKGERRTAYGKEF